METNPGFGNEVIQKRIKLEVFFFRFHVLITNKKNIINQYSIEIKNNETYMVVEKQSLFSKLETQETYSYSQNQTLNTLENHLFHSQSY